MRAGVHFDGDVRQPRQAFEPPFVDRRRLRGIRDDGRDHGGMTRTDLPQVQIGQAVAAGLDALADASAPAPDRERCRAAPGRPRG